MFTYSLETDAGKVRLLIFDTDEDHPETQIFTDAEIDAFLSLAGGVIGLAAADALDTMAISEAMIQKVIKLLDVQTDGSKTAGVLQKRAADLREQVIAEGMDELPDTADLIVDDHTWAEHVASDFARSL